MAEAAIGKVSNIEGLATCAAAGARLVDAMRQRDGFETLCAELSALCRFQNFIVYMFREGAKPLLFQTNLGLPWLQEKMADYINGLYALDPFHRCTVEERTGLFRMRDIMPEAFMESEYFRYFYRFTSVYDELRYVVQIEPGLSIHVFIEREGEGNDFTEAEVALFEALEPFVSSFVTGHAAWLQEAADQPGPAVPRFDLRRKIMEVKGGVLTPREVDTVELMLKGHSTKSMARVLCIDDGTVANHKRNIYAKLEIHSQAQLFDLFLRSLTGEA